MVSLPVTLAGFEADCFAVHIQAIQCGACRPCLIFHVAKARIADVFQPERREDIVTRHISGQGFVKPDNAVRGLDKTVGYGFALLACRDEVG